MEHVELPKFYFAYQVKSLRFLGVEVLRKTESPLYRIYSFCMFTFSALFVFSECVELAFHRDFNNLVIVCNYTISHFLGMVKVAVFYTNRKKIGDLMVSLHEGVYEPDETRGGTFEKLCIKRTLHQTTSQMICYGLSIAVVIVLGMTSSLHCRLTHPQEMWKLPYVPISVIKYTTESPRFEIAFMFQVLGILVLSLGVYTSDVTVACIIAHVRCQIQIFERCVRNYEERALKNRANKRYINKETLLSNCLFKSIDHHLNIIDTTETVEHVCSYLALCVFLANLILLCLLMYYTSLMPIYSLEFIQYLDYCFLITVQVFLYCWWGNELTLANEALARAAAEAYNPDGAIYHAKILKLLILRAQRPLFLTAGKFVPLSLETYTRIIKGSISYFMVLRQVNRKNNEF